MIAQTLWRSLPVAPRRAAVASAIAVLRPRLGPARPALLADKTVPRVIVGFLSAPTGLGQSARLAASAFQAEGYSVSGIDIGRYFYEGEGGVEHGLADGRALGGPLHLFIVCNAPLMPYVLFLLGRRLLRDAHVTGYWAWELPRAPETWRKGLACVHDIAAPSRFAASAIAHLDAARPVRVAPHPVAITLPEASLQPAQPPLRILSCFNVASGFERKNPLGLIAAFKRAFSADAPVLLDLQITGASHYPLARAALEAAIAGDQRIVAHFGALTPDALEAWWRRGHAFALLHRSEGFGLPIAEAMARGLPTIATGFSGNADFMDESTAFPVAWRFVDVADPDGKYSASEGQWAQPDEASAASVLRGLLDSPEEARSRASAARASIKNRLTAHEFVHAIVSAHVQPKEA